MAQQRRALPSGTALTAEQVDQQLRALRKQRAALEDQCRVLRAQRKSQRSARLAQRRATLQTRRSSFYESIVIRWQPIAVVAHQASCSDGHVKRTVVTAFKYRHPEAWAVLSQRHQSGKPYLWEMRLFESQRLVPATPSPDLTIRDKVALNEPGALLDFLERHHIETRPLEAIETSTGIAPRKIAFGP